MRFTRRIFEILPYWPKYSVDRKVGISCSSRLSQLPAGSQSGAYLFFCKSRANADYVDYVALNDAYIGEMSPPKSVKLFTLTLSLPLLLSETLVTFSIHISKQNRALAPFSSRTVRDTHSSLAMGLNCTASSVYSRRQAGQRPFKFSLI